IVELADLSLPTLRALARYVPPRHRRGHFGDVAHLCSQVPSHRVDVVGKVFPGTSHARHVGLPTQPSFGADFARYARHLTGEAVELVHHGVERFLQLQNLATHIDGNLAGAVAVGDGRGHLSDVAHLPGQVTGHEVDVVGEVLPGAAHPGHLRLTPELAFGADFPRHPRHLAGEGVEL